MDPGTVPFWRTFMRHLFFGDLGGSQAPQASGGIYISTYHRWPFDRAPLQVAVRASSLCRGRRSSPQWGQRNGQSFADACAGGPAGLPIVASQKEASRVRGATCLRCSPHHRNLRGRNRHTRDKANFFLPLARTERSLVSKLASLVSSRKLSSSSLKGLEFLTPKSRRGSSEKPIHLPWPCTLKNPVVPACWMAETKSHCLPLTSWTSPVSKAPFRGQSEVLPPGWGLESG